MKALSIKIMILSLFIILVPVAHIDSMQNNGKEDHIDLVFGSDEASMSITRETAEKSPTLRMMLANLEDGENSLFLPLPDLSPNTIESIAAVLQGDRSINEIRQQYESDSAQLEIFNNVLQYLAISEDPIITQEESPDIPQTLSEPIIKEKDLSAQDFANSWANVLLRQMSEQKEKAGETYLPENVIENILGYAYEMPRDLELWLHVLLKTELPFAPKIRSSTTWLDKDGKHVLDTDNNIWQIENWKRMFNYKPKRLLEDFDTTFGLKFISSLNPEMVVNANDTQVALLKKSTNPNSYKGYTCTVHNIDGTGKSSLSEPLFDIIADVRTLQPNLDFDPRDLFLTISPENNYAILRNHDGILIIYQISGGNWKPVDPQLYADMYYATIEPTGQRILLNNGNGTSLKTIDTETWQVVSTINANGLSNLKLSRNGVYAMGETDDDVLHIYDADTAQEITSFANIIDWQLTQVRTDNPEVIVGISDAYTLFVYDVSKQEKIMEQKINQLKYPKESLRMTQFNDVIILSLNGSTKEITHKLSPADSIPLLLTILLKKNKIVTLPVNIKSLGIKKGFVHVYSLNKNKFILGVERIFRSQEFYSVNIQPSALLRELWRSLNKEQRDLIYALFNNQQKFGSIASLSINKEQKATFYSLPKKLQDVLSDFVEIPMMAKIMKRFTKK